MIETREVKQRASYPSKSSIHVFLLRAAIGISCLVNAELSSREMYENRMSGVNDLSLLVEHNRVHLADNIKLNEACQ